MGIATAIIYSKNLMLNIQIEHFEKEGIVQVRVRYNGPALDPMVSGDELSMALVKTRRESWRSGLHR